MENNLQLNSSNRSTPLKPNELEVATILWNVNQLVAFPISDTLLESWSRSVVRIRPETTVRELEKLIYLMKIDKIEWDSKKGIQNIFTGLAKLHLYNNDGSKLVL